MKLKPINWTTQDHTHLAVVMGIQLAVFPDKDGTWTASLSGVPNQRPELQKLFDSEDKAKGYAVDVLLQREINKHFTDELTLPQKTDGIYNRVWNDFVASKDDGKPDRYTLNVSMEHISFGRHVPTVEYLHSMGYKKLAIQQRSDDFSYDILFGLE